MALIDVDGVTKRFPGAGASDDVLALDHVSLQVDRGEIVCVVGPSGCGKTTLLNILAGFERPTTGSARFDGSEITGPSSERGVVFQEAALFPWLTARQNIEFGLREKKVARRERARVADEYLELIGLRAAGDRRPAALSGGMRQRVALARALANGASLLLLDEPFAALDAQTKAQMQSELLRIWEQTGTSMLLITHSIDEAVLLGHRVVVMAPHPGRILDVVDVSIDRPRDDTSAEFNELKRRLRAMIGQSEPSAAAA